MSAGCTPMVGALGGTYPPTAIANLKLWLDADMGVTIATGVSQWDDQSGQGNNVTQATGSAQLALVSSWRNGRAAIQGAAGKSISRGSLTGGSLSDPATIYAVGEWNSVSATTYILFQSAGAQSDIRSQLGDPSIAGNALLSTGGVIANATPFVMRGTFNGASSSQRWEPHGAAAQTASGSAGAGMISQLQVLNDSSTTLPWLGKMATLLIYSGLVAASDDVLIMSYLRSRYNVIHT